jgi:YidC/Oxa1 family membrane protein insertase
MDRQAWIAIILSVIGLVAWQIHISAKYRAAAAVAAVNAPINLTPGKPAPASVDRSAAPSPAIAAAAAAASPVLVPEVPDAAQANIEKIVTPQIELRFTDQGGGIAEAIPQGKQHVAEGGVNIRLNHMGQVPIGAVSEKPGEGMTEPYVMRREGDNAVVFERTAPDGLKITKKYVVEPSQDKAGRPQIPAVRLEVNFTNTGAKPFENSGYYISAGSAGPIHRRDLAYNTGYDWLSNGSYHTAAVTEFDAGHIPLIGVQTSAARSVITHPVNKAAWIAVKDQFYATILTPLVEGAEDQEAPAREVWARRFDLPLTDEDRAANQTAPLHGVEAALALPALKLAPGETKTQAFQIYSGPKFHNRLVQLGHGEQEVMNFGKFKAVSVVLLNTMNTLKAWVGNYAIAIILLTILVKMVLLYPQLKATASMRRMSALAPKMTELREKFKEDPARLNAETMKLYKDYGVNPLGGCLPTLIQMPIFFGFLYMLGTAAELRNASFLWVHDLSTPDTVGHILGFPINVLPILMVGTQFWQMSLTPKTGDPQQQKMFMFMPLLFGFFCYSFAAALALYYTMQGALTIIQLYATRNQPLPTLQKRTLPPGGGGGLGGLAARLSKPKGGPGSSGGARARV